MPNQNIHKPVLIPRMLPDRFDVVLSDPPWGYYGQQAKWGAAAKFYETVSDRDMPRVADPRKYLHKRSVLFLWATSPRLDFAMSLLRTWGLSFRGVAFVWVKAKKDGTPIGARGVRPSIVKPTCEFVLSASMAATGRPLPLASESVRQVILAPVREHSRKPDEVFERIESLYPNLRKLEMFSRERRLGWACHGREKGKFSSKDLLS